jgi:hypothetical protein
MNARKFNSPKFQSLVCNITGGAASAGIAQNAKYSSKNVQQVSRDANAYTPFVLY